MRPASTPLPVQVDDVVEDMRLRAVEKRWRPSSSPGAGWRRGSTPVPTAVRVAVGVVVGDVGNAEQPRTTIACSGEVVP